MSLDVREYSFWVRHAFIQKLEEQFRMMEAARAAQADGKGYKSVQSSLMKRIADMRKGVTKQEKQARAWDSLSKIGKR